VEQGALGMSGVYGPAAKFFVKDDEQVKTYSPEETGKWLNIKIELPGAYAVVSRRTFAGPTLPIITKVPVKKTPEK
jgi:hypothetical protein